MDDRSLTRLLDEVAAGIVTPDDALRSLRRLPFADLGYARIDHHRRIRQGIAEAVYAPGKTPEQCAGIVVELLDSPDGATPVVLTRADAGQVAAALAAAPGGRVVGSTVVWRAAPSRPGSVLVATAGTADLAVAEECVAVLAANGVTARTLTDVGVAGLHRLLASLDALDGIDVAVVVAGMEGALATVVGGLVEVPVVAVPTSVGYGAALEGVTALLAMLSSCAAGVTVVGIDNGFGAACAALRVLQIADRAGPST